MITINLKPGSKRAKGRAPLAGGLASLKIVAEKIKDPFRLGVAIVALAIIGFVGYSQVTASATLSGLQPKLTQARAENQRFRAFLGQKRRLESVRDSIAVQIATIRNVDGDRYIWPHILDEITRAVPVFTWLTDVAVVVAPTAAGDSAKVRPPVQVQITGRTVDIQGYTRLLRQLEDSPWLKDVTAISANSVIEHNRAVTAFVLRAAYSVPDTSRMQTVPVNQSLQR